MDCLSDLEGRCLNVIPRTMLESRGGESIKGTVIADEELIVRIARGERIEPHVGEFTSGITFTRYYWQLELDARMRPTGRDVVSPPGPPLTR